MEDNRSVPAEVLLPHLTYARLEEAIGWLCGTFGFVEHYRYGEPVSGAQIYLGKAYVMVGSTKPGFRSPVEAGCATQALTVFVEDVEGHYARTRQAGANVVEELHETVYGELQYGVRDVEGHLWLFSRHVRNVSPESWGAQVAHPPA